MNSPSTLRVVLLVSALSLRRLVNRISHLRTRGRKTTGRAATARKAAGGKLLLAFMALVFVFQSATVTVKLIHSTALAAQRSENPGLSLVGDQTLELLHRVESVRQVDPDRDASDWQELQAAFRGECAQQDAAERATCWHELEQAFASRGAAAFRARAVPQWAAFPESGLWYLGSDPGRMLSPLALIAILLGITVALQHLAADRDLAKIDTGLEWLFSFPVPARALFLSRALEAALVGPLVLVTIWPFYSVIFWCAGYGALGILLGAGAALYTGALAGCVRVVLETMLRRFLSLVAVARVQSVLLVLSYASLVASFALASSTRVPQLTAWAGELPGWALYSPSSLPLWLTFGGRAAWFTAFSMMLLLCAVLAGSVRLAEYMVRDGVTSGSGNLVASRSSAARSASGGPSGFLSGVALKELRAILRDRQLRAQALITPVVLVALQLWLNPNLLDGVFGNPRHVATAAFALAMLVLASGASAALATEGQSLWLLYTVPQRIERLLIRKLLVWIALALLFSGVALALVGVRAPGLLLASLPYMALVIPGIGFYSVIAFGLGTLGTDPLEAEPRKRIRVGSVYLFMILASMFSYALYVPSRWAKLAQLVLSALLSFALWQKVKDHSPYLLDPTEAPPARIAVADGVMAALGFFVLQGLLQLILPLFHVPPGQALLLAFVGAGLLIGLVSLLVFEHSGVPDVLRAVGLKLPEGSAWPGVGRSLALGLGAGLAAAAVGLAYLWLCQRVEFLRQLRDESFRLSDGPGAPGRWWFFALAVFAAPPFEEFIFRGVLFRGMRRSLTAPAAALASAAVFALVHPALAAAPVFVLGLLAALAYERSRWLATPMLSHMVYNAAMVGGALLQP